MFCETLWSNQHLQHKYMKRVAAFLIFIFISVLLHIGFVVVNFYKTTTNVLKQHSFSNYTLPEGRTEVLLKIQDASRLQPPNHTLHQSIPKMSLCSRVDVNPDKCGRAIFAEMALVNITCPTACVTFDSYGRFNNNMIQIANAIGMYVDPNMVKSANRTSISLHPEFRHYIEAYFDIDKLAKTCIYPSWYVPGAQHHTTTCSKIDGKTLYFANEPLHQGLRLAWLLLGATRINVQQQNAARSAVFGTEYSVLHARYLENSCHARHQKMSLPGDICDLSPKFVAAALHTLGHIDQHILVCSDKQQNALVRTLIIQLNATNSPSNDLYFDIMLMLYAKRMVGNIVSTFSKNIVTVRHTIFGNASLDVLK